MNAPANLFPGLSDISDVLEEFPIETSRYVTLLHEIDAKCVHSIPGLNNQIDSFVTVNEQPSPVEDESAGKLTTLNTINRSFEELIPSLEEKMHVSSIMLKTLESLTLRLELAYEVAIKNQEIPEKLRLGVDNHPAMHLHHELMQKIEATKNGNSGTSKSLQSLKSESRREAMAANKKQVVDPKNLETYQESTEPTPSLPPPAVPAVNSRKRATNITTTTSTQLSNVATAPDAKKRKNNGAKTNPVTTSSGSNISTKSQNSITRSKVNDYGEPLYCYCNQVAYGEMVGCDGATCELEWFHLPCIGLTTLPRGKWYCDDCKKK